MGNRAREGAGKGVSEMESGQSGRTSRPLKNVDIYSEGDESQ